MPHTAAKQQSGVSSNGKRRRAARLGPELRRPMILEAAHEVFLEKGFDGASMSAIAARAEVTKPVIYDSFANKDELFEALRARERERILSEVVAALPDQPSVDLEASVIAVLTAFLRYVKNDPTSFRTIFLGEGASREIAGQIQRRREELIETVAAVLEDWGRGPGEDPRPSVTLIANALVGGVEGVSRAVMKEPDRFDPEEAAALVAGFVVRGASGL